MDSKSESKKGGLLLTRRQTVMSFAAAIAAAASKISYGDVSGLMGVSGRETIDKILAPATSLKIVDPGNETYTFYTNGLPDHPTGFDLIANAPDEKNTPKFEILPIPTIYQIPKNPKMASMLTSLLSLGGPFGVMLNGVVIDPLGPFWKQKQATGWQYEVMSSIARVFLKLDFNNAHIQPSGEYHYHGRPEAFQQKLEKLISARGERKMCLMGFAADGFPIYAPYAHSNPMDRTSPLVEMTSSYSLILTQRPSSGPANLEGSKPDFTRDGSFVQDYEFIKGKGTLDECNGRFGVTPEYPNGTYYYCLTDAFPHIPRLFRGTPHVSFSRPNMGDQAEVPQGLTKIFG